MVIREETETDAALQVKTGRAKAGAPLFEADDILSLVHAVDQTLSVIVERDSDRVGIAVESSSDSANQYGNDASYRLAATLPVIRPELLGDPSFCHQHRIRYPYVTGEMANGIATTSLVIAVAKAGMLGFFGAAGLSLPQISISIDELQRALGDRFSWGINLIHSPNESDQEDRTVDLLIKRGVVRVSASAFMTVTPAVVRYAVAGLTTTDGLIHRKHHLFAKLSRPEIATQFLSPAPQRILDALLSKDLISRAEAELARSVPLAEDITVEADSGGHTDGRPLVALFPQILALRNELVRKNGYRRPVRVGASGGLGTPNAVAAAFALGAAYVMTGSINQSAVESGLSETGKQMLAKAKSTDVMMAPAADMFEQGVKVQVLKSGTMFAVRALKLYEVFRANTSLSSIPADVRATLERDLFQAPLEQIWEETKRFWQARDEKQVQKAESVPKHKMALVFRWYLGNATRWAIRGEPSRLMDYQIWCGPAMGAFNDWVADSFLEAPMNRTAVQIARNLLHGAAVLSRAQQLRSFGVPVPNEAFQYKPRMLNWETQLDPR